MTNATRPKAYSYIRISSKGQIDGQGLIRQSEKAIKYAADHSLDLDTQLKDVGKSGYHGDHIKSGALGGFLKLVEDGQIPVGSYLLVEALDRLSRQNVLVAQSQFIDILLAGIHVVTLIDQQVYHRDRAYTQLILSLSLMKAANDESVVKSERISDAIRKRKLSAVAGEPVYNHHLVGWLDQKRIPDTKHYTYAPNEKAKAVQRIFELADQGVGGHSIARILNTEGFPVMRARTNSRNLWRDATIHAILRDETVIGTYRVTEQIDGETVELGTPVKNFYPSAVSDELYWRVQRNRHKPMPMGSKGRKYTNLFARTTSCSKCGAVLKLVSGGASHRKKSYFACMQAQLIKGHPCGVNKKFIPYEPVEEAILSFATDFYDAAADMMNISQKNQKLLHKQLVEAQLQLHSMMKRRANLLDTVEEVEDAQDRRDLVRRIAEARTKIDQQTANIAELSRDIQLGDNQRNELRSVIDQVEAERKTWKTGTEQEIFESRSKVSQMLREFITTIEVDFDRQETTVWIGGFTSAYRFDRSGNFIGHINLIKMLKPTTAEPFLITYDRGYGTGNRFVGGYVAIPTTQPAISEDEMRNWLRNMNFSEQRIEMAITAKRKIIEANG
jgi:DNA invertase Pin-like site-specific DNA recombinase